LYGRFFRPGTDGDEQLVRQRVNLAEASSSRCMSDLAVLFSSAGKHESIWNEANALRTRWPKLFPSLCGIYNAWYWNEKQHTLDNYTLAEKRFEDLKPFYVDCFETLCRLAVIAAAIECIIATGKLGVQSSKGILTVEEFATMPNGNKPDLLKSTPVAHLFVPFIDSKLRNGIGHHAARYNVTIDIIEYENHNKKGTQHLTIPYIRFCEQVVKIYRQIELLALYANWLKGKAAGLTGRIV
jgi:hypothetical protein